MRSLIVCVLACAVLLCPLVMRSAAAPAGSSETGRLSAQDLQTSPKPPPTSLYQGGLTRTFSTPAIAPADVRALMPDSDRQRTEGVLASTTWLNGAISTEAEVASSDRQALGHQADMGAVQDPSAQMVRLGLSRSSGPVRYGANYRNAGQGFATAPDQTMREVWGEWSSGWMTVRSTVGKQWNNAEGVSARSRQEQDYGQVGLSWNRPIWPVLAVTYSRRASDSPLEPAGMVPERSVSHSVQASLGYQTAIWKGSLASNYILGANGQGGADSRVAVQTLTASFRPMNTLAIEPTLSYRSEQQDWSGARLISPSASLALSYRQSRELLISASGNYSGTRSSDHVTELDNIGGKGLLTWGLQPSHNWMTMMSFESGYNRQINRLLPSADTQELSGIMRLVLIPLQ